MKYYIKKKGTRFPMETTKNDYYNKKRYSRKWDERLWIQSGEIVARELQEQ